MAKKRLRDFRRVAFTAKTGELLRELLVDKTFKDHFSKCDLTKGSKPCSHKKSGTLGVARLVESAIKVGEKRATLDIPDPYCTPDYEVTIRLLEQTATRIRSFADSRLAVTKRQQRESLTRLAEEIQSYAERNPLMVLADIAAEEA